MFQMKKGLSADKDVLLTAGQSDGRPPGGCTPQAAHAVFF